MICKPTACLFGGDLKNVYEVLLVAIVYRKMSLQGYGIFLVGAFLFFLFAL